MIYVVLGMHKSGTTLVSQILHHSGVNMVDDLDENISYDKGNKYERESTLRLDMDILGTDDLDQVQTRAQAKRELTVELRERMRGLIHETSARHADWGFKDPRCSLLYPLWQPQLPQHRLVVVYRHPAEAWPRFRWVGLRRFYSNYSLAMGFLVRWHDHNIAILDALEKADQDYLVISYREMMSGDRDLDRLRKFTGRELVDRRRPDLYRGQLEMDPNLRLADRYLKFKRGRSVADVMNALAVKIR